MIKFFVILLCILSLPVYAGQERESNVRSYDDYIKILYMPSYEGFRKAAAPIRELSAKSQTIEVKASEKIMKTNTFIKQMYEEIKAFNNEAGREELVYPDAQSWALEVSYRGQVARAAFSGFSDNEKRPKFIAFKKEWSRLYDKAYAYLVMEIKP